MEKSRTGQPWHKGNVLNRVPEPPAAPAELVICPIAAKRDAERQEGPCGQHPWAHKAGPEGINTALNQRGNGKGKRDRETDIAEIKKWRVEGETRVLQKRVQTGAVSRNRRQALERV